MLGGCSPYGEYLDRRDTIALSGGNAVATNAVTQMVDPWPLEEREPQHRLQRPEDADRGRAISDRPGHTAARRRYIQRLPRQTGAMSQNDGGPVDPSVTAPAAR